MTSYAEVIGDPVAHSRSPAIHSGWLAALGLPGDYRATRVTRETLGTYLEDRRRDSDWRGCNVTAPLKRDVIAFIDRLTPAAAAIGAVNVVHRDADALVGHNSDIDGIAAALAGLEPASKRAIVIGNGGAARAMLHYLQEAGLETKTIARQGAIPFAKAGDAIDGAALIVNATPLGMTDADPMPADVLTALARAAPGAAAFDMVYAPPETAFLNAAREAGLGTIGGRVMLEGQARAAFRLFFGAEPPVH